VPDLIGLLPAWRFSIACHSFSLLPGLKRFSPETVRLASQIERGLKLSSVSFPFSAVSASASPASIDKS